MFHVLYVVSVILVIGVLAYEWKNGGWGYRVAPSEYLTAAFVIFCPLVNTMFACYTIYDLIKSRSK
jgi:hypothetical protein